MIRLSKSVVGELEANAVKNVIINNGYLGMGSEVGHFEAEIADYVGVPKSNVVCVNSGTAALHLAVDAITSQGDEVLVPSLTFLSSFQAISASGAIPVACEVYEESLTIDLEDASRKVTDKTKAIMFIHYASNPYQLEKLYKFAKEHNLRIIEDAAHAFGCSYDGKKIGSFGDIICFSFDGIKNITSGEGGAIIASDTDVLNIVKDARLLGIEKDSEKRYAGARSWDFDVTRQGFRYHMSNIFAAIGRVQLMRLDTEFAPKRMSLVAEYKKHIKTSLIKLIAYQPNAEIVSHIMPVRVLGGLRDSLKAHLEADQIQTGIHYKPNHLLSLYKTGESLPVTEKIYDELITLPLHPDMQTEDVLFICRSIEAFIKNLNIE